MTNPQPRTPNPLTPADLASHQRYGLALRHDVVTLDETVIPAWTEVVNVGQPSGVTVSRFGPPVPLVICRISGYASLLTPGHVFMVDPRRLLVALGEIEGTCECPPNTYGCTNRR